MTDTGVRRRACAIALLCFVVFNANGREIATTDSQPAKLLAIEIVKRHTLSLNYVVGAQPALGERAGFARDVHGNYRSGYPLPSALVGAVTAWMASALHLIDLDAPLAAPFVSKITASALVALAAALAFAAAARRTSRAAATFVAIGFALGTGMWSGASQTLWQQETSLCALMAAVLLLDRDHLSSAGTIGIGVLLGAAGWARPQLAPAISVLALSLTNREGHRGLVGWIPIALFAALAVGINLAWFGHLLGATAVRESLHPAVHDVPGALTWQPWKPAAGLLFSPSRGLFVFSPVVLLAAAGIPVALRAGRRSVLTWTLGAALVQFVCYTFYSVWWGGHTFGPRYMLDVLPPLVPVAAAGAGAIAARRAARWLAGVALAWSIAVSALGAFVYPAEAWNTSPSEIDRDHARLWDWRDSQIVRAARAGWNPRNFAFLEPGALRTSEGSSE